MATGTSREKVAGKATRASTLRTLGGGRTAKGGPVPKKLFYTSEHLAAATRGAGKVQVDLLINDVQGFEWLTKTVETSLEGKHLFEGKVLTSAAIRTVGEEVRIATVDFFERQLEAEVDNLVSAYRTMLRESMVRGDDPVVKAALNRARVQERILGAAAMVDQSEACELLGLSTANPSATMKRKEERGRILRFLREGRVVYPLLQFDIEGRRIWPVMARLIADKPGNWSDFRLLHWLTRPHLDFDGSPGEALGAEPEAVLAAFRREIEPPVHG